MASKKRRAKSGAGSGGSTRQQPQSQGPTMRASAMLGTLRLVALLSATAVALFVFEALQGYMRYL